MLARYWSQYKSGGVHPSDDRYLNASNSLRWSCAAARQRTCLFQADRSFHGLVHTNLNPQPFVGNLDSASVYILMANPGLELSDYDDDFGNATHITASENNLRQTGIGFYPLLEASANTGASRYWLSRVRALERDLVNSLEISPAQARKLLVRELAVIESGPYHSKTFPGAWCDRLPSSRAARAFVRRVLLPRAEQGDALVFVMRRSAFWRIGEEHDKVIRRHPKHAQLSYILEAERKRLLEFLVCRERRGVLPLA